MSDKPNLMWACVCKSACKLLADKYYDAISQRNMYLNPKRLLLAGLETKKCSSRAGTKHLS